MGYFKYNWKINGLKMSHKILISCLVCLVIYSKAGISQPGIFVDTAITTLKSGNWSDPLVWKGSRVPGQGDSVFLLHDITIDVNAVCRAFVANGKNVNINAGKTLDIKGFEPVINPNTTLIDSNILKIISSAVELENGIYRYRLSGPAPAIKTGDIILGPYGDGYLRKVSKVTMAPDEISLNTTQGDMEDLFSNAQFGYGFSLSDMQISSGGTRISPDNTALNNVNGVFDFELSPRNLYQNGPVSVDLEKAKFSLSPNMFFNYDYGFTGLKYWKMQCANGNFNGEMQVKLSADGSIAETETDTLMRAGKSLTVMVGGFPVNMRMEFYLIGTLTLNVDATIQRTFTYNTNNNFNLHVTYENGGWSNDFAPGTSTNTMDPGSTSADAKAELVYSIKPLFKIRFYRVLAPYLFLDLKQSFVGRASYPSINWDFHYRAWAETGVGVEARIFTKKIGEFGPKIWSTDTLHYRTPFKIIKTDGDLQVSDDTLNNLPKRLKVKVVDEKDAPQQGVRVRFSKLSGTGAISDAMDITDAAGIADIGWRIGSQPEQQVEVSVLNGENQPIPGSPVQFFAGYGPKKVLKVVKVFNQANTPVFTTNFFKTAGIGKGGHIYAGTINNGLYKCVDSTWTKLGVLTNNNINDIQTDQFGGVWIAQYGNTGAQATTGGINYFPDSTSNGFMYYGATVGAPTRNARGIFCDTTRTNGDNRPRVWTAHMAHITAGVSTTGAIGLGLNAANPYFNKITNGIDVSIQNGSIPCIGGNSEEVWAYASVNFGKSQILRYSSATGALLGAYDYENTSVTGMTSNFTARAIHFDAGGARWIGLISGGLLVWENGNWTNLNMPEILPAGTAISTNGIGSGKFGKVFIATSQGLVIYNGGDKTNPASYKRITTAEGLPSNNVLDAVERPADNLLIVTTDNGIVFITGH